MEIWKDIPAYEGLYMVSDQGRIKNVEREYIVHRKGGQYLKKVPCVIRVGSPTSEGYLGVKLTKDGVTKSFLAHRLVMAAFEPNPENKRTVNHKDGNKTNNRLTNLEWASDLEQIRHAYATGLKFNDVAGEKNPTAVLKVEDVIEIKRSLLRGERSCDLSRKYNVSHSAIQKIKTGHNWRHVTAA
jgi:hypothetical protein